jgi:hypothetical protein
MSDDNIIKFQRPKPKKELRTITRGTRKVLIWLAIIGAVGLVWAYFQFVSPPSLT